MNKKTIDKIKEQIIHDKSILESILIMQRIEDLSKIQDKDHKDHIHNLIQDIAK